MRERCRQTHTKTEREKKRERERKRDIDRSHFYSINYTLTAGFNERINDREI